MLNAPAPEHQCPLPLSWEVRRESSSIAVSKDLLMRYATGFGIANVIAVGGWSARRNEPGFTDPD
jgi:hypothetical protein